MSHCRAHLEIEPHPLGTLAGAPPFAWNIPPEPVGSRALHLRALAATFQVLSFDPITSGFVSGFGPTVIARVATGEPLSVFPRDVWRDRDRRTPDVPGDFESRIIWCEPQHVYGPANQPRAGRPYPGPDGDERWPFRDRYRYQLGMIWVAVFDSRGTGHQLPPCQILARFLLDQSRDDIPEPLLGLQWSVFMNRRFERVTQGLECPPPPHPGQLEEWRLYDGP